MSVASCNDIRQKIRSAFASALPDYRETVFSPGWIGRDGAGEQGQFWSCELGSTTFISKRNVRMSTYVDTESTVPCSTEVTIRALLRYALDDMPGSYDDFLAAEVSVAMALGSVDWAGTQGFAVDSIARSVEYDGTWHLVTIRGTVVHGYGGGG